LKSTLADLQIATFAVEEVVEGTQTGWSDGRLVLSLPQLAVGAGEPALAEATVEVVRPGDSVRLSNVLDVVVPSVKVDNPGSTFLGVLGAVPPRPLVGSGWVHRLSGVNVLSVCDWHAAGLVGPEEFPDSFVDMAGPGADRSPYGATSNVVVRFVPEPGASVVEADRAVRRETLRVARDIAASTLGSQTIDVERFAWPLAPADASLPVVVAIVQVASEGPLTDTFLRGEPLTELVPIVLDPRELLDGALTNGAYDWPAVRNVTAAYQASALIRELYGAHDKRLRFGGLVLTPGYLDTPAEKQSAAEGSARLVLELGANGVVCTTFSSGNSHTDTMLTVRACERLGIATVGIVCETSGGLFDHVPEADCLVSTGNEDDLVDSWTPGRVIGSGGPARAGEHVPTWAYLGACAQTGDATWTAVPG